jgi:DNA-binding HxlR family transcriptional regulator
MATRSAADRRQAAKITYDAYLAECPTRQLLDRLADKWVSLLLTALANGPRRYSELARRIAGISPKMLTQTLRSLERDGLVHRELVLAVPVQATYSLTPLGRTLLPVMAAIKDWAECHIDDVRAARTRHDRSNGSRRDRKASR